MKLYEIEIFEIKFKIEPEKLKTEKPPKNQFEFEIQIQT